MNHDGHDLPARGDRGRRMLSFRQWAVVGAFAVLVAGAVQAGGASSSDEDSDGQPPFRPAGEVLARRPQSAPPGGSGAAGLRRRHRIFSFATRYRISNDLSAAIYDAAIAERIEPELAYRLVQVESEFKERARSRVGAVGLTQLMPATARAVQPGVSREQLYDRKTNLRIGFRYLRSLVRQYKGDLRLALLAYNRGPVAVENELAMGLDPSNRYETQVMKGYRGSGILK
jgi:soluble lytic murein transglycosylase-like protein